MRARFTRRRGVDVFDLDIQLVKVDVVLHSLVESIHGAAIEIQVYVCKIDIIAMYFIEQRLFVISGRNADRGIGGRLKCIF